LNGYDSFNNIDKGTSFAVSHHGHLSGTMSEVTTMETFKKTHPKCDKPNEIKVIYDAGKNEFSVLRGGILALSVPVVAQNVYYISLEGTAGNEFNINIPTANLHQYKDKDVLVELTPRVPVQSVSVPVQSVSVPVQSVSVPVQSVPVRKTKAYVAPDINVTPDALVTKSSKFKIVFDPEKLQANVKKTFIGDDVLGLSEISSEGFKAIATTKNITCILDTIFWSLLNKDEKIKEIVIADEDIYNALVMYIKLKYNVTEIISSIFVSCLLEKKIGTQQFIQLHRQK
jgi:hypothetical protein